QADTMSYAIKLQDLSKNIKNVLPSEMSFVDIYKQIGQKEQELEKRRAERTKQRNLERLLLNQEYLKNGPPDSVRNHQQAIDNLRDEPIRDRDLQVHWVEYWKKLSIPSACTSLVLLGIPLGLFARRSARGLGLGLGLLVAAIFWGGLLIGQ